MSAGAAASVPAGPWCAADRARAPVRHGAPLLPALATVLLLCAPADTAAVTAAGTVTPADAASAVLVVVCGLRLLRHRPRPLGRTAALVLGAPVAALALATVTSADPAASLPGLVRHLQIFVLVPAALLLTLRDARDFRVLAGALVLLALVQGAIGVHQYLTATGASYMGREVRAVGTFGPLDVMGMATAVGYGLTAALALGLAPGPRAPRWQRPAALTCAAVLTVPLAVSFSRGAWIATAVAGAAVLLAAGARVAVPALAVLTAAAVVLAGAGTGSDLLGERIASIGAVSDAPDRSVTDRYALWAAAAGIWRDHPLTGAGLKEFPAERDGHASLGLSSGGDTAGAGVAFRREPLLSPHNMYLMALSEQGLIGATALVGGWAVLLVGGVRRLRAARRGRRATDCGLAATGLLVWQAVDFLSADIGGPSTVLTAVALGLVGWWALAPGRWPVPGGGTAAR
ncbi:membrane protein [Streptomyces nigrescens]|uniref:Membrane protein n=1 Tax=Streptomyces nigrescens TaxID=1920 RepID=A0ABN6QRE4_STRNI|nr:O-antigen ligase family protein [Streptomyces nigrescens]BDM67069.1 membrane protein [Streptomyces nigrescens]